MCWFVCSEKVVFVCKVSMTELYTLSKILARALFHFYFEIRKVVSFTLTVLKAWSHRRTDMYRKENGLKYAEFGYPVTKFISSAAQSSRDRYVEPGS